MSSTKNLLAAGILTLSLLLQLSVAGARERPSHSTIKPGKVSFPVTVHIKGRPVRARFTGVATKAPYVGTLIQTPRIIAKGKKYYLGQEASRRIFKGYCSGASGQCMVWGDRINASLTRNPNLPFLPSLRPAMIDFKDGKLQPAKMNGRSFQTCRYYNGPAGFLGPKASAEDFIGLKSR